jgi:hypothetical protein
LLPDAHAQVNGRVAAHYHIERGIRRSAGQHCAGRRSRVQNLSRDGFFRWLGRFARRRLSPESLRETAMFYVTWFGQVALIMALTVSLAVLVPTPAMAGLMLVVALIWAIWLLGSLIRHLTRDPEPRRPRSTA